MINWLKCMFGFHVFGEWFPSSIYGPSSPSEIDFSSGRYKLYEFCFCERCGYTLGRKRKS